MNGVGLIHPTNHRNDSGLPFYDILLLNNLPKSAGLPVGTTQVSYSGDLVSNDVKMMDEYAL
jgi:hypothetical protein